MRKFVKNQYDSSIGLLTARYPQLNLCEKEEDKALKILCQAAALNIKPYGNLQKPRFLLGTRASCPHFSTRCGRDARVPRGFRMLPYIEIVQSRAVK